MTITKEKFTQFKTLLSQDLFPVRSEQQKRPQPVERVEDMSIEKNFTGSEEFCKLAEEKRGKDVIWCFWDKAEQGYSEFSNLYRLAEPYRTTVPSKRPTQEALLDADKYITVEHAYQASKTWDRKERAKISRIEDARDARVYTKISRFRRYLRPGFEEVRDEIMWELLQQKFRDPKLQTCLLYTSPSPRDGLLSRMPSSA